jgi:hypothetical protein
MIVVLIGLELREGAATNRTRVVLFCSLGILGLQCRFEDCLKSLVLSTFSGCQFIRFSQSIPAFGVTLPEYDDGRRIREIRYHIEQQLYAVLKMP